MDIQFSRELPELEKFSAQRAWDGQHTNLWIKKSANKNFNTENQLEYSSVLIGCLESGNPDMKDQFFLFGEISDNVMKGLFLGLTRSGAFIGTNKQTRDGTAGVIR
jgi:hypothetical protein